MGFKIADLRGLGADYMGQMVVYRVFTCITVDIGFVAAVEQA